MYYGVQVHCRVSQLTTPRRPQSGPSTGPILLVVLAAAILIVAFLAFRLSGDSNDNVGGSPPDETDGPVEIRSGGKVVGHTTIEAGLTLAEQATGMVPWVPTSLPSSDYEIASVEFTEPSSQGLPIVLLKYIAGSVELTITQAPPEYLLPEQCGGVPDAVEGAAACSRSQILGDGQKRDLYWAGFTERDVLVLLAGLEVPGSQAVFEMIGSMQPD